MVLFGQRWLYLSERSSIWAKVVVFWQRWFYLSKGGSIWAKVVLFGQIVAFGQSASICVMVAVL